MRLEQLRISGFRAVAHTAQLTAAHEAAPATKAGAKGVYNLTWSRHAFAANFPVDTRHAEHMMSAVMGPNSAGKSTLLLAMSLCLGNTGKLDATYFHGQDAQQPIIMEATLRGQVEADAAWCKRFVRTVGNAPAHLAHAVTIASVWSKDGRLRLLRGNDGLYYKQTSADRALCERLVPAFRMTWADTRPGEAAELKRDSLLSDLVMRRFQPQGGENIAQRLHDLLTALDRLLNRDKLGDGHATPATNAHDAPKRGVPDAVDWSALDELESRLAQGLAQLTPQSSRVQIRLDAGLPRLEDILGRGLTIIDDGAALPFEQHGLGLQRAFAVSVLRAWCDDLAEAGRDYIFAIEEPEIYLHPHATRTMLRILEQIAQRHQVVFTTHATEFINRAPLQHILMVNRRRHKDTWVSHVQAPQLGRLKAEEVVKVQRYLCEDRSDMLFARAVLLVEGQAELFALPSFAATLGMDLDAAGVSVVFVNGIGNFGAYHQILSGFGIPHTVLMDGDGKRAERERAFKQAAHGLVVLEHDFERELVDALTPERRQTLAHACRMRRGKPGRPHIPAGARGAQALAKLGKPLVGRVAGELCRAEEIRRMPSLVRALENTLQQAQHGAPLLPHPDAPTDSVNA